MKFKKPSLFCLFLLFVFTAKSQQSSNINLLSNLDYNNDLSDVWGYANDAGEYALVGVYNGISVVDVTNPYDPVELGFFNGPESIWRDLKTWGDYLYCINDEDGDGGAGLQILNLEELINGVSNPTYIENMSLGFETAHNIYIDEYGVLYVFGADYGIGGALMYDLVANPENPPLLGVFNDYYLHDGMARGDTLWGGAINDGVFTVIDVSDKENPEIIGSHATPNNFSHNCWISDDGDYLFTTDEVSGAYVAAYDVSNLNDVEEVDRIQAWSPQTTVIPHNTHVDGDFIVTSYYADGVSVVDVSNPSNMVEVGYYDTSEDYSGDGFNGAWGAYPWLPSGYILVTDIETGLYVLEPKYTNASFVDGYVTDAVTEAPISNVQVQIIGSNNSSFTELNGYYEIGMGDSGTYDVVYSAPGYNDLTQTITIASGEVLNFDVQLAPFDNYQSQFTILNALNLNGIADASVNIYNENFNFQLVSDGNGVVTQSLMDGTYSIFVGSWSYQTICSEFTISGDGLDLTYELDLSYSDDFSLDLGWEVESDASLTSGVWERGTPNVTYYQGGQLNPGYDASGDCGSFAFVTGNTQGAEYYSDDVDDGRTRIISPIMDLRFYDNPILNFRTWFRNMGGESTPNDSLLIKITNGIETVLLDYRTYETSSTTWANHEISFAEALELTNQMQIIIETMDMENSGHLVEAGFDKFMITSDNLGIESNQNQIFDMYPNPSSDGFVYLDVHDHSKILVHDVFGGLLFEKQVSKGLNKFDLSFLASGTYLVTLLGDINYSSSIWIRN